jgi:hypothetical protein
MPGPDGSIWDDILDTEHAVVIRTYIERWPRRNMPDEKVLGVVVEPDGEHRCLCPLAVEGPHGAREKHTADTRHLLNWVGDYRCPDRAATDPWHHGMQTTCECSHVGAELLASLER